MKVLVVGSGAREHALVWKIARSDMVEDIFVFPGNAGIEEIATVPDIKADTIQALLDFALEKKIDLTVVGPEKYLAEGITDLFKKNNLKIFGVNKEAAQLESSKAFAKELMREADIPTAKYFLTESIDEGKKLLRSMRYPLVIKADGLAEGKGVSIVQTPEEGEKEMKAMFDGRFKDAGKKVVIEEFLKGEELSLLLIADGKSVKPLLFAQDHKPAYDGDTGPNTGGMGAYAPVCFADARLYNRVVAQIIKPLFGEFKKRNIEYKGILYIGLMMVNGEPFVLEYNVRFGDPETEALMYKMKSDIVPYLLGAIEGNLDFMPEIQWHSGYGITVVMASEGYPGEYKKGVIIEGLDKVDSNVVVFHAGTAKDAEGRFITKGGRVLMVTGKGDSIEKAAESVYKNIEKIKFNGAQYRKDIAFREINRIKDGKCS